MHCVTYKAGVEKDPECPWAFEKVKDIRAQLQDFMHAKARIDLEEGHKLMGKDTRHDASYPPLVVHEQGGLSNQRYIEALVRCFAQSTKTPAQSIQVLLAEMHALRLPEVVTLISNNALIDDSFVLERDPGRNRRTTNAARKEIWRRLQDVAEGARVTIPNNMYVEFAFGEDTRVQLIL